VFGPVVSSHAKEFTMGIFANLFAKANTQAHACIRRNARLSVEVLEDRLCLAANIYTVDNFTDLNPAGGGGVPDGAAKPMNGDLRWCVGQARANPGSEIDIPVKAFTAIQLSAELLAM
jgi:hypothetical protein